MGAWIEIGEALFLVIQGYVAPLVGAWIEIYKLALVASAFDVAPLVGAWIEIIVTMPLLNNALMSLLSWERGLK